MHFQTLLHMLAQNYQVPDAIQTQTSYIFLLESPHVEELQSGFPVSGGSGKSMTKNLIENGEGQPLGHLVKKIQEGTFSHPLLERIGLMNVCPIPMQLSAYTHKKSVAKWGSFQEEDFTDFFEAMEKVRTQNDKDHYKQASLQQMQDLLVEDLRKRLESLSHRKVAIIPCGKFASKFFRLAGVSSPHWKVVEGMPHPSYNLWDHPRYHDVVHQMKQALGIIM